MYRILETTGTEGPGGKRGKRCHAGGRGGFREAGGEFSSTEGQEENMPDVGNDQQCPVFLQGHTMSHGWLGGGGGVQRGVKPTLPRRLEARGVGWLSRSAGHNAVEATS